MVTPADIDETPHPAEPPGEYVVRLAREKADAVWVRHQDLPVFAADTTVVVDGEILGKPGSADEGRSMLRKLSGRGHFVHTGIALRTRHGIEDGLSTTEVEFAELTDDMIEAYWDSGEPQGKAGAYAIQGLGAVFVSDIVGSYTGVMGLPLFETAELLRHAGIPVWRGKI